MRGVFRIFPRFPESHVVSSSVSEADACTSFGYGPLIWVELASLWNSSLR